MATPMTPPQLLAVLKAEGLKVVEYQGWDRRCRCCPDNGPHRPTGPWNLAGRGWGKVNGTVTHITAGNLGSRSVEQYIADIINGDPEVPCKAQMVVAPDGTVYLNSAGRANHAGLVGSKVQEHLIAADFSLSDDYDSRFRGGSVDGNAFTYGIENIAASAMSEAQRTSSVRINAAIARHYGWTGQESVGHGEISSARSSADPNLDTGKFRESVMAQVKKGGTTPPPVVPPTEPAPEKPVTSKPITYVSGNLASYDKVKGLKNRVSRAKGIIPEYLAPMKPTWFHFQECAVDVFPELDKKLPDYHRIPQGGKGRQSYYRKDAGIKIIEAKLLNVSHMLLKDTKEHLVIAWEDAEGYQGVYCNFHNENEGSTFQTLQLRDVMTNARKMSDKHGFPRANIVVTGDSNLRTAATFAKLQGWSEAIYLAKKKIGTAYKTTNGWATKLVKGSRIDVDVFQKTAVVDETELLHAKVISDHWSRRVVHRLVRGK